MSHPKPTVGRIVHYVSYGTPGGEYESQCRAAIVTAVHHYDPVPEHGVPYVDLCVLNPEGMFFNRQVLYSERDKSGTWHWPERERPEVEINVSNSSSGDSGQKPGWFQDRYRGRGA